jgi:hypothetical protein
VLYRADVSVSLQLTKGGGKLTIRPGRLEVTLGGFTARWAKNMEPNLGPFVQTDPDVEVFHTRVQLPFRHLSLPVKEGGTVKAVVYWPWLGRANLLRALREAGFVVTVNHVWFGGAWYHRATW